MKAFFIALSISVVGLSTGCGDESNAVVEHASDPESMSLGGSMDGDDIKESSKEMEQQMGPGGDYVE